MPDSIQSYFGAAESVQRQQAGGLALERGLVTLRGAEDAVVYSRQVAPFRVELQATAAEQARLELATLRNDLQFHETTRPIREQIARNNLDLQAYRHGLELRRAQYEQAEGFRAIDQNLSLMDRMDGLSDRIAGVTAQVTRFGYREDPHLDPNSAAGIGNRSNRMTPGHSVALKKSTATKMGLVNQEGKPAGYVRDNGTGRVYRVDSTIPETSGDNDRIDFFDPNGDFIEVDGSSVSLVPATKEEFDFQNDRRGPPSSDDSETPIPRLDEAPTLDADEGPSDILLGPEDASDLPTSSTELDQLIEEWIDMGEYAKTNPLIRDQWYRQRDALMQIPEARKRIDRIRGKQFGEQAQARARAITDPVGVIRDIQEGRLLLPPDQLESVLKTAEDRIAAVEKLKPTTGFDLDTFLGRTGGERDALRDAEFTARKGHLLKQDLAEYKASGGRLGRVDTLLTGIKSVFSEFSGIPPSEDVVRRRVFEGKLQNILNKLLKERSGAAVTDQEMERFLIEAGDIRNDTNDVIFAKLESFADRLIDEYTTLYNSRFAAAQGNLEFFSPQAIAQSVLGESGTRSNPVRLGGTKEEQKKAWDAIPEGQGIWVVDPKSGRVLQKP